MSKAHGYDVAIVGAGPAGSAAAIRLALAGKRAILIEKEKFPREKLCGEFISPECLEHFDHLGVLEAMRLAGAVEIAKTRFYACSGRGVEVPSQWFGAAYPSALGLSRAEMDRRLLERAREVGVDVLEGTAVTNVLRENGTIVGVGSQAGEIRARVTLDATGRARSLARRADADEPAPKAEFVAFKTHVSGCGVDDHVCEIYSYARGYGGSSRVENGLHNLCFICSAGDVKRLGSNADRVLREIVLTNKRAAEVMQDIRFVGEWHAIPILRYGRGNVAPMRGLLALGDAAVFIDPFTGSGMLLALESARLAAGVITRTDDLDLLPADYEREFSLAFDARLRMCSLLRRVSFAPPLAEMAVRAFALSRGLRKSIVHMTRR